MKSIVILLTSITVIVRPSFIDFNALIKAGGGRIAAGKVYSFGFTIDDDTFNSRYHYVACAYKLALDNLDADVSFTK
ncbi:hypothetical protein [Colwellia sp. MT41]|uniref:hypothetical protein n=1 Tax=Colwellia sp. MT41 TaxID=58049 RepID=UPI0012F7968F|nr:hypothetical protein [Colwellia sp. MT41]